MTMGWFPSNCQTISRKRNLARFSKYQCRESLNAMVLLTSKEIYFPFFRDGVRYRVPPKWVS
jgi:hypothetical protein